jgi:uncharacterized OB-fold protein
MSDGVKGGNVNRPGSAPEIQKLPRTKCARCGLVAVNPVVVNGKCRNRIACEMRIERDARRKPKP